MENKINQERRKLMESATKHKPTKEILEQMTAAAFPDSKVIDIHELKEGFFNAAYRIKLSDNREVVLKIAPPEGTTVMTHEKNIMYSEVHSMKMIQRVTKVPVAKILFYDNSKSICNAEYFFMEKLSGESFSSIKDTLDEKDKKQIQYMTGRYNAELNRVTGTKFGYYGQSDKQGEEWFTVFRSMIMDTIQDADHLSIDLHMKPETILELLEQDKPYFLEVVTPKFVHWDLWAGNVFVENNQVTGLIDFERCLWGDELIEVGFRSNYQDKDFLKGYGLEQFSESQKIRIKWYDVYLFLIVVLETDYRKYDTRDTYHYAINNLKKCIEQIKLR
ncbi:phosphotransferase family protein [Anaerocolumna cellulosilytica]|nr:phosphotransferase [Anaerocolumna cellulosilytica]MBB5197644.1 aminoglycoside phosphotransferase (APT) family kinase protein [Anaerocolumna cellulosilytica]